MRIARRAHPGSSPSAFDHIEERCGTPSIIGTSAPSGSTIALSTPAPANAAIKCSTVRTWTPSRSTGSSTAWSRRRYPIALGFRRQHRGAGRQCRYSVPPVARPSKRLARRNRHHGRPPPLSGFAECNPHFPQHAYPLTYRPVPQPIGRRTAATNHSLLPIVAPRH